MQQSSRNLLFERLLPSFKVENVIWLSHDILRATDASAGKKVDALGSDTENAPLILRIEEAAPKNFFRRALEIELETVEEFLTSIRQYC